MSTTFNPALDIVNKIFEDAAPRHNGTAPAAPEIVPAKHALATLPSLYVLEEELVALLDTEELVSPEQQEAYRADLSIALQRSVEKRDRVAQFIRFCELQDENCKAEQKRLAELRMTYEQALERCKEYAVYTLRSLGRDAKGKWRKLAGNTSVLTLREQPKVEIVDDYVLPDRFVKVAVAISRSDFGAVLDAALAHCLRISDTDGVDACERLAEKLKTAQREPMLTAIKDAIKAGEDVPGADLVVDRQVLIVR